MHRYLFLIVFSLLVSTASAVEVAPEEQTLTRQWIAAKFAGQAAPTTKQAYLEVSLKSGELLKNMATTKVYHKQIGALPLKIVDKTYRRGLYCPSVGKIVIHLPSPAKRLRAVFGVDSNRVQSFYSNADQGAVIGAVEVNDQTLYRSAVMREGLAGVPIDVDLKESTQFTLAMRDAGGGVVERVDFNQADWADARVELANGKTIWLGELPTAPLRSVPSTKLPFSFTYDGRPWRAAEEAWQRKHTVREIDEHRREHTLRFLDPKTGLQVRCVAVEYTKFPAVEWTLYFKNTGKRPTPILEDILALDTSLDRDNEGEFVLHHSNGSPHSLVKMSDVDDYAPRVTHLTPQMEKVLSSKIGLPASHVLPFFNVDAQGRGAIVAVGWPGQWQAKLTRDKERGLRLTAGQATTHFRLMPGEEVRSPLIALLFWKGGDWLRAQNLWRRWMIEHSLPRTADGKLPPPHRAASSSAFYMESTAATEQNQKMFIDRYLAQGIRPDYWWIDAGWYDYTDYWLNVGTWSPNRKRFPRGLRPISDHLHKQRMKMILWFTPECVTRGSRIDRQQSQWLLKGGAEWWMGHALIQGEYPAHVNDSGLTLFEDVAGFGIGNPDTTVTGNTRLADGKWHLVTATRMIGKPAKRSAVRMYVDGKLEAAGYSMNIEPMTANDSWGVGRQYQTRGIVGDIDDVRVYDSALNETEVAALFDGKGKPPTQHYTFDGSIKDHRGQHHGQPIGQSDALHFVAGVTGKPGDQALRFNNDYGIKIPNKTPHDFTLSCWVKMNAPQPPPWGRGDFRLFNFGNAAAAKWMTEHIDGILREQGVDLLRHDGIPPLAYWRANDAPDRLGISEIKHIEGLLGFWDELRRRHPQLRIDICSGGGSRNELETLRRAVPLWRSDYAYETTGMQSLTYGMSLWIPYFGTGTNASDSYTFRSQMAPAIITSWDVRRDTPGQPDFRRRMLSDFRRVADHYYSDFYPLTAYRNDNDVWMAWQWNQSERGIVQAFRRPQSPAVAMQFKLRGLDPKAVYRIKNFDNTEPRKIIGKKLQEEGLLISLPRTRSAAVIAYERIP